MKELILTKNLNLFQANAPFQYPLKILGNQYF